MRRRRDWHGERRRRLASRRHKVFHRAQVERIRKFLRRRRGEPPSAPATVGLALAIHIPVEFRSTKDEVDFRSFAKDDCGTGFAWLIESKNFARPGGIVRRQHAFHKVDPIRLDTFLLLLRQLLNTNIALQRRSSVDVEVGKLQKLRLSCDH